MHDCGQTAGLYYQIGAIGGVFVETGRQSGRVTGRRNEEYANGRADGGERERLSAGRKRGCGTDTMGERTKAVEIVTRDKVKGIIKTVPEYVRGTRELVGTRPAGD